MKITYLRNWYVSSSTQSKGITVDSDVYIFPWYANGSDKSRKELIAAAHDDNDEIARIDERYRDALEQSDSGKNQPLSPPGSSYHSSTT